MNEVLLAPAVDLHISEEELALVVEAWRAAEPKRAREAFPPYYLMNVRHPIVEQLYRGAQKALGLPVAYPMSDRERVLFELSLMRPEVVEQVVAEARALSEHLKVWGHCSGWEANANTKKGRRAKHDNGKADLT